MLVQTSGLAIGYGSRAIASGVDLSIDAGSITCLLGPNGVGKSTLFKTLLGLIPPLAGEVLLGGTKLAELTRPAIAREIALVPQAHPAPFAYTVLDLVMMGRTAYLGPFGAPRRKDYEAARAALDRLGIATLAPRAVAQISGGQQQLVLIARALAQQSSLIVMDEPTASLDFANAQLVMNTATSLADEGLAVVLSTHDPEQAFAVADRVAMLTPSGTCLVGPTDQIMTADRLSELYGLPLLVEQTSSGRYVVTAPGTRLRTRHSPHS